MCEPITNSFFGTQPRITQVPPIRYSSAIMTRAPWPAAIRAARTPPEPPPMTNRSVSNSAIPASNVSRDQIRDRISPIDILSDTLCQMPFPDALLRYPCSDVLAAFVHFGTELGGD